MFLGKIITSAEVLSKLTPQDLSHIRAGFRDKYIIDAAVKIASGEINLEELPKMSTADAKKTLMKIKGVGSKVADCVLLFALGRYNTFPQDVWTKRILLDLYGVEEKDINSFVEKTFGNFGGVAQQYLYYYYAIEKEK